MTTYDATDIEMLSGIESVRRRPGMYIGGTDATAMHVLAWQLIDHAVGEHVDGFASCIRVRIDGTWIEVDDDGRGIPVDPMPKTGAPALEVVCTQMAGLHGFGLPIVSALASELDAEVWRDGRHYRLRVSRGRALAPLEDLGPTSRRGTRISFTPDFDIVDRAVWDRRLIAERLRGIAATHPKLTLMLGADAFRCPQGMADHVRHRAGDARLLHEPIRIHGMHDGIAVDVALAWTGAPGADVTSIVNGRPSTGGTQCDGMSDAMFEALRRIEPSRLAGVYRSAFHEVIDPGLVVAIGLDMPDPRFTCPRRYRLTSSTARDAVVAVVTEPLHAELEADQWLRGHLVARLPAH
jgi:DNA gyrase subunit B